MKAIQCLAVILVICSFAVVSAGWCGEVTRSRPEIPANMPEPIPVPAGTISKIEGNRVTLTREDNLKEVIVMEVKDAREFKVGEKVRIHEGQLVRIPPEKPEDTRATLPIPIPNHPEGGKHRPELPASPTR